MLQIEFWDSTIQEKLAQDNSFLNGISNVPSENILNGKIVHIPQAGDPSRVVKNRTVFPADVQKRADGEVLYSIDEYTTDPVTIPDADTKELSYDKRRSIIDQDVQNMSEEVAEGMLLNFIASPVGNNMLLPDANKMATDSVTVVASGIAGATGNRKAYALGDLQRMQNLFRKQKTWQEGKMNCLLSGEAVVQMFPASSQITATYMASVSEAERRMGIVFKAYGWNIYVRSTVYLMAADKTFKPFGAIVAATDTEGCLFWNFNMLEKAIGTTESFDRPRDPLYYGDIYAFLVRMGGRAKRKLYEGVNVLYQAAAN